MNYEAMKTIGAKEFKARVFAKLKQVNPEIKDEDLYFSQTQSGYYVEYKPNYPESSPADFIVFKHLLVDAMSVHGNYGALVPTIKNYENIDEWENSLRRAEDDQGTTQDL